MQLPPTPIDPREALQLSRQDRLALVLQGQKDGFKSTLDEAIRVLNNTVNEITRRERDTLKD